MIRSLNTGVGGIRNFQTSLDVIANNLANLNTVGFKGGRTDFAEALTQTIKPSTPDGANKSGSSSIQMANGVSTNSVTTLYTQGAVNQTGKITDMAIAGEGYFIVKEYTNKGAINNAETGDGAAPGIAEPDKAKKTTPAGIEYATRAGDFRLDSNGYLVNNSGMRVQGYSDLILEPTSVGDIKFDRGDYMSSVEVIKADDNFKLLTTNKNHGLKTGNIVVLKSDSELTAPTLADGSQVPGTLLQAGTPYYVHAISDNQIAFYDNLTNATNNDLDKALLINPPKEGVRVVKKLASYESSSVSQINNENTIFTKAAHGFKDGDKVEFYVGNSTKATAAQTVDSKTGIGDYTVTPFEVDGTQGALETGDIIYFSNGAKFTLSAPAAANATQLQGRLEGGNVMAGEGATISSAASLTIDTDGVKTTVSANVDGDKSGAFTRSFFISLRGEKSFTLHSSQEDASLRVRPIKFDNLSIKDAVVTKVASSTTAEIQNISVDGAGKVNIMLTDGTQYSRGQVLLKKFTNEQALSKQGSNLYSNLQNAGGNKEWGVAGSDGYGRVEAGALELSNVDVAREFSKLITTQRAFQANSRMVSASDEILMELLRLKR
jgi:flagellar hook protein FlgE|tara:strand:+ start:2796 stop:4607 length:1812 start_codon:yes stop_codon:yes gene_type:complete